MNNLENFISKRNTYPLFVYNGYEIEENETEIFIKYDFEIVGLSHFNPTWTFKKENEFSIEKLGSVFFNNMIFNLGMVELVSYWKLTCSPKIIIKCARLDETQIKWWEKLYLNGLGEFLYTNGIYDYLIKNNVKLMQMECDSKYGYEATFIESKLNGNLIPVGGGKDSVVTLELLRNYKENNTCYIVNPRGASTSTAKIAGYEEFYAPKRTLDQNMLNLNKEGYLNGHTPFSAILAFSSYIAAIILNKKYIVLSNESSANEPNVEGTNINHQYSKSLKFENDFRFYCRKYLCKNGPEYFSLLRPWSEWRIVKEFVKYTKYFKDFKSCNVGSKQDIWCENCPKCLYVYIMLSAFLDKEDISKIFNSNMLDNENLKQIFEGLISQNEDKPFECVGTKEEINLSINMFLRKNNGNYIPKLFRDYMPMSEDNFKSLLYEYNHKFDTNNNVPEEFIKVLKEV